MLLSLCYSGTPFTVIEGEVEIIQACSTSKSDGAAQPSKKHKRLPESQPELSAYDGEDTVSYKRHIAAMLSEYKKQTPSQELVRQLMKLTFTKRRQGILAAPRTANNILGEFPFLAPFEHVCQHTYLAVVCT